MMGSDASLVHLFGFAGISVIDNPVFLYKVYTAPKNWEGLFKIMGGGIFIA